MANRFHVALSFPGEDRIFVRQVAEALATELTRDRVFYDKWYEVELLGADGDLKLQSMYEQADLVVPFFSENYSKSWCSMEWETIRGILLVRRKDDAVIPVHLDDTDIPGWPAVSFGIRLEGRTPQQIADVILAALAKRNPNVSRAVVNRPVEAPGQDPGDPVAIETLLEPGIPTLPAGRSLRFAGAAVFADSARCKVVLAHRLRDHSPIRITGIKVEHVWQQIPAEQSAELAYTPDVARLPGYGLVRVKRYVLDLFGDRIEARWIESRDPGGAVSVRSEDLLDAATGSDAVTMTTEGDDAHYQFQCLINPQDPGLYRVRFVVSYNVAGDSRRTQTDEILVYQRST